MTLTGWIIKGACITIGGAILGPGGAVIGSIVGSMIAGAAGDNNSDAQHDHSHDASAADFGG